MFFDIKFLFNMFCCVSKKKSILRHQYDYELSLLLVVLLLLAELDL